MVLWIRKDQDSLVMAGLVSWLNLAAICHTLYSARSDFMPLTSSKVCFDIMLGINNRIDDAFTYFEESAAEMTGLWRHFLCTLVSDFTYSIHSDSCCLHAVSRVATGADQRSETESVLQQYRRPTSVDIRQEVSRLCGVYNIFLSTACYFILCMYSCCLFLLLWFVLIVFTVCCHLAC